MIGLSVSDKIIVLLIFIISALILIKVVSSKDLKKSKANIKMFGYRLIYTDQKSSNKNDGITYGKLLFSEEYNITGKPDFIYRNILTGKLFPVEIKSGKVKDKKYPYDGDLMQLALYFLLIEDIYNKKPKSGKLIYSDYMFTVKNSRRLRNELFKTLKEMRNMLDTGEGECSPSFIHCKNCICNGTVCEKNTEKV